MQEENFTYKGRFLNIFNALAVGVMAMFSFKKVLYIFGAVALGATFPSWALASMVTSGVLIAIITAAMYPGDPWLGLKKYLTTLRRETSWLAHLFGHLGGLIKAFMAFAGVWGIASALLGSSAFALLPVTIAFAVVGGLTGLSQYFVEASTLIPESQDLFTRKSDRKIAPTHNAKQQLLTMIKWPLVVLHALGQGLGFFACLLMFGSISSTMLPVVIALGVVAALIIGPSTGRYYGEPFFGWGATIYLLSDNKLPLWNRALKARLESQGLDANDINDKVLEIDKKSISEEEKQEALARAFGYQLVRKPLQAPSLSMSLLKYLGYVVGFVGAGFKGALAFAGTVVFFSLCLSGTLTTLLVAPPVFVLAISLVVGIATWIVQSARACPNTAHTFVDFALQQGLINENSSDKKAQAMPPSKRDSWRNRQDRSPWYSWLSYVLGSFLGCLPLRSRLNASRGDSTPNTPNRLDFLPRASTSDTSSMDPFHSEATQGDDNDFVDQWGVGKRLGGL